MAFNTGQGAGAPNGDINVTPLVDVVLVLLIIFMVVTPLLQVNLDADIPKPCVECPPPPPQDQVVMSMRDDGAIWLNREVVTHAELAERVEAIMSKRTEKIAFVNAADSLEFGRVVHVMDTCRGAGVAKVGIIDPLQ